MTSLTTTHTPASAPDSSWSPNLVVANQRSSPSTTSRLSCSSGLVGADGGPKAPIELAPISSPSDCPSIRAAAAFT